MRMNERVAGIIEALKVAYPDALCALHYQKDYDFAQTLQTVVDTNPRA